MVEQSFKGENEIYMVRVTHNGESKEYFFSSDVKTPYKSARSFPKAEIKYDIIGETATEKGTVYQVSVENISDYPAYFVNPKDLTKSNSILCSDAFFTLMAGEKRQITLTAQKMPGLFFDIENKKLQLDFAFLNK